MSVGQLSLCDHFHRKQSKPRRLIQHQIVKCDVAVKVGHRFFAGGGQGGSAGGLPILAVFVTSWVC